MKYRKKPVTIEAFKYGYDGMPDWFMDKVTSNEIILRDCQGNQEIHNFISERFCEINTLKGLMIGKLGDYIIKGIKGEIYPCKPDIFEATYEKVD